MNSLSLTIKNYVTVKEEGSTSTWIDTSDRTGGFIYDRRLLDGISGRYEGRITPETSGILDGYKQNDFQSGVIEAIDFLDVLETNQELHKTWTPIYKSGEFSIYSDNRRLFSDYSYTALFPVETDERGLQSLNLHSDCQYGSIVCRIYGRDSNGIIHSCQCFEQKDKFTLEIDEQKSEISLDELEDGLLLCKRTNEYIIQNNKIYLNGNRSLQVGRGENLSDILSSWEKHTPEQTGSLTLRYTGTKNVSVVVVDSNLNVTSLKEYSDLSYIMPGEIGYSVDAELGILTLSGTSNATCILSEDISELATVLPVYNSVEYAGMLERGVVQIDNEYIAYDGKSNGLLLNCIRGFNNTIPEAYFAGRAIVGLSQGDFLEGTYYVKYTVVPRIDYEISVLDTRRANGMSKWLNINPIANSVSNKIISLSSNTIIVDSLVLSTDESVIGSNLYGPIYVGTDIGNLTATAYDTLGVPVEELPITISILSGPGFLDSSRSSITKVSNSEGEIYSFFHTPYSDDVVFHTVKEVSYEDANTVMVVEDLAPGLKTKEITVYQILKHDPVTGTVGKKVAVINAGTAAEPNGLAFIDCVLTYTEDFNRGVAQLIKDNVRYTFNINFAQLLPNEIYGNITRFYLSNTGDVIASDLSATVYLYQEDAIVWDSELLNGIDVVLYEWNNNYIHPRTNLSGAYGPVRPDKIVGNKLYFLNRHLRMPEPENDDVNLGGYHITAAAETVCIASCIDPYSNTTLLSNKIRFKIILPSTLNGVDDNGILSVPYGFTLATEEFNIDSGLAGANFFTLNPKALGINQLGFYGRIDE